MFYDWNAIMAAAKLCDENWYEARVVLKKGDTAYAPGTTKKVFSGEGVIDYSIAPTGWKAIPRDKRIYLQHLTG